MPNQRKERNSISVVIPVYNRSKWIGRTLDRIIAQTVKPDEIVICNDGSTDDIEAALYPYRDLVRVINIENSGPAVARKTAIENATGKWIALCDSDDFWETDHLQNFFQALRFFPSLNMYFSDFRNSDEKDRTKFEHAPNDWLGIFAGKFSENQKFIQCTDGLYRGLMLFQACFQSACIFQRSLYENVGGIDPTVSRWPSEDFHLTMRMAAIANAVVCVEPQVLINKHGENFSRDTLKNEEGRLKIIQLMNDKDQVPEAFKRVNEDEMSKAKIDLFRLYYWHSDFRSMIDKFGQVPKFKLSVKDHLRFFHGLFLYTIKYYLR